MTQIQLRRDTTNNWQTANPILAQGEVGIDLTNKQFKIGDGATTWNDLPYHSGDYTNILNKPQINNITLSGNQTGASLGLANASEVEELGDELNQLASDITTLENNLAGKQDTLTAGNNITIQDDVISATNVVTTTQGIKLWKGTQTEYEGIGTKDPNTLYIITGA